MKDKVLNIIISILAVITVAIGCLCFFYSRIPEGLIIIGCTIVTCLIVSALKEKTYPSRKAVQKAGGRLLVQLKGVCRINGEHGNECVLQLYENGVYVDMPKNNMSLVKYSDVELQDSQSVHHIQLNVDGIGVFRFVCDNKIKLKAIEKTFEMKKS